MNQEIRKTILKITVIQIAMFIFAGLGILVLSLAGTESPLGRVALYSILGVTTCGTGFTMSYALSLSWSRAAARQDGTTSSPTSKET